jgi:outer membrane lipoprotein-sorting protein
MRPANSRRANARRCLLAAAAVTAALSLWALPTRCAPGANPAATAMPPAKAAATSPAAKPAATSPATVQRLTRAVQAPNRLNYRATETLTIRDKATTRRRTVRIVNRAPYETRREYLSRRGQVERVIADDGHTHWDYLPSRREVIYSPSLRIDRELWQEHHLKLLLANYVVRDGGEALLHGRKARWLIIAPRAGHVGPAKRLLMDESTGLIVRSEVSSSDGARTLVSALSDLTFPPAIPSSEFAPPRHARKQTVIYEHVAVLPLAALARQCKRPLLAPKRLPDGYRLESARLLRIGPRSYVHLRYFDGVNAISLFEEPSKPAAPPSSARRTAKVNGSSATWRFYPPLWSLSWRERGLKLTLVADLPRADLVKIADSVTALRRR